MKNGIEDFRKRDLNNSFISLTSEQVEMLEMSEQDIQNNNIISEAELNKLDKKWFG